MKGILFSEPLFPLVVDGSKIQTRRIIKPQPTYSELSGIKWQGYAYGIGLYDNPKEAYYNFSKAVSHPSYKSGSRYKVGETVYLKEPYHKIDMYIGENVDDDLYYYKYGNCDWLTDSEKSKVDAEISKLKGWKNKMFMPESAARYFIKITSVRVERLQDISDEDCLKEGIYKLPNLEPCTFYGISQNGTDACLGVNPREAYADLINSIDGKGTWERNPYVWVYDFELSPT